MFLQENVSCLNTSLVILMLARRKAKLPFYLNALREKEYAEKYPGCLLNNFHNLLRFWQRHYLNKDKDSTCLENVSSSNLSFHTTEASVKKYQLHQASGKSASLCVSPSQDVLFTFYHFAVKHWKHSDRISTCTHAVKTKDLLWALPHVLWCCSSSL